MQATSYGRHVIMVKLAKSRSSLLMNKWTSTGINLIWPWVVLCYSTDHNFMQLQVTEEINTVASFWYFRGSLLCWFPLCMGTRKWWRYSYREEQSQTSLVMYAWCKFSNNLWKLRLLQARLTPLIVASMQGERDIAELLLSKKADITAVSSVSATLMSNVCNKLHGSQ